MVDATSTNFLVAHKVQITLLRQPGIDVGPGRHAELAPKDAALLALLAVEGAVTRTRLAAWLWPSASSAEQARANLRQRLLRLRRFAGMAVVSGNQSLKLAPGVTTDLMDALAALAIDPHAVIGDLLAGLDYPDCDELEHWLRHHRSQWRSRCLATLKDTARDLEDAQRYEDAIAYAQRLTQEEPLQEHYHRLLMRLHHRRGDRSAALTAYDELAAQLRDELDVEPSGPTQTLRQFIEHSQARAQALAPLVEPSEPRRLLFIGDPNHAAQAGGGLDEPFDDSLIVLRALADDRDTPHALLRQLACALLMRTDAAENPPTAPDALLHFVARLTQQMKPVSLAISDLQFADGDSLDALAMLLRQPHWVR